MRILFTAFLALFFLAVNAQQNTLLTPAFWQGKPDAARIKAEVEKGNSPSQLTAASYDAVVFAINSDTPTDGIKYLLGQPGNDVGKLTHDSRNYLHWAASKGNTEIMEYLLAKGAKFDNEDSHGSSPLLFAAGAGQQNTKVYELLTSKGVNLKKSLNADGANVLLLAIANDPDMKLTDYFIAKGLSLNSVDAAGNNAFNYAARGGNIELLKKLIQKGVKPTQEAMLMAAQGTRRGANTLDVYEYLESLNLKPTATGKDGQNALHSIVRKPKQNEIIQYFLAKGVDVNQADEQGNTVLMNAAASNRDKAVFAMLLPLVKDINQTNKKGLSALAMAVRSNTPEIISLLISKGADVKKLDKAGNSLAFYAIESYRPQAAQGGSKTEDFDARIKLIKAAGLDVNALQENGNTLFHVAIAKNDVELLKSLQALGINVNTKNKEGFTALHRSAMIAKDDSVMKYLLSIGAKKDDLTGFQETAFDLATENESLSKNNVPLTFLK